MLKKWTMMLLCLLAAISLLACSNKKQGSKPDETSEGISSTDQADRTEESPVRVYASFNAMEEFVTAVGKDKVEVVTMIPDGMEPHDFEPKAKDLAGLSEGQIFVYSGLGMESWVDEAIKSANNTDLIIVEASKGFDAIENTDQEEIEEHGQYDPHIWLSLKGAELEVKNIKDALVQIDPSNKKYYEGNYDDFAAQLENLYNEYKDKFQSVSKNSFVTGHAAFSYLCRDFGLEQNSVEDTFAEGEPSAQQLAELVEYCRENDVTTVFAEEMASKDVSETLASEVDAKVETIYTIESNEDDMTYLERMSDTLSKIYDSLR